MTHANDNRFNTAVYPIEGAKALAGFLRNKEATSEIFRMLNAIDGPVYERNFRRFCSTEAGRQIIAEKRNLCATLSDRESLRRLPEGTLGREYLDFVTREGLSAEGFQKEMEESGEDLSKLDASRQLYINRIRHSHDLFHVLTGYGRDFIGELGLLGFTYQQSGLRTFAIMLQFSILKARKDFPGLPVRAVVREGHRIGKNANRLHAADWESLLAQPLHAVRAQYNIKSPELYLSIAEESAARDETYRKEQAALAAA
ncbi:MAG: Coq4 family protein [Pseudomonadota bacterium]